MFQDVSREWSRAVKENPYWVYVIQSLQPRVGKRGNPLPGFYYVGMTTSPARRLREHNGEKKGGGKYTSKYRPWEIRAIYGPYSGKSEALKAERALKHGKRGESRCEWTPSDSKWCRGEGRGDQRIGPINSQRVHLESSS